MNTVARRIDSEWLRVHLAAGSRSAALAARLPLCLGSERPRGQQAHRAARRRRTAHDPGRRQLRTTGHCPLRPDGRSRGDHAGGGGDGIRCHRRTGDLDPAVIRQRLCGCPGRARKHKGMNRPLADRAFGRQCGAGHHDAGPGRGGRPRLRCGPHHGQHHPPGPATDQDRAGRQAGLVHLLHAAAGAGAGLWRLRRQSRPQRRRAGRHRHPERRFGQRLRHSAARWR